MTKTSLFLILAATLLTMRLKPVWAQEESVDRKGFILGLGLGGGGAASRGEKGGGYWSNYKIGGGLNERILLLAEPTLLVGPIKGQDDELTVLMGLYFSAQLFLSENFYVRPKVGPAFSFSDFLNDVQLAVLGIDPDSKTGFAAGLSSGYEWRLTKRMALSPEVNFDYGRVLSGNHFFFGAAVDLRWYF